MQRHGPEALRRDVIACAFTARPIGISSPHGPVPVVALESLESVGNAGGLIHLAFLTRDRVTAAWRGLLAYDDTSICRLLIAST